MIMLLWLLCYYILFSVIIVFYLFVKLVFTETETNLFSDVGKCCPNNITQLFQKTDYFILAENQRGGRSHKLNECQLGQTNGGGEKREKCVSGHELTGCGVAFGSVDFTWRCVIIACRRSLSFDSYNKGTTFLFWGRRVLKNCNHLLQ